MADIRIKDLATTASTTASDDFLAVDGTTNGTRKLSAATPSFATSVTVPGVVGPTSTDLTLTGGSTGASLVLGQASTDSTALTANVNLYLQKAAASSVVFRNNAAGSYTEAMRIAGTTGNLLIGTTTDAANLSGGLIVNGSGTAAAASNTTTGALRVTGGVGVSGAGYFGGALNAPSLTGAASTDLTLNGGSGTANVVLTASGAGGNVYARPGASSYVRVDTGLGMRVEAGTLNVTTTTSASSSTVGALTIGNGTAATNVAIGGGNVNAGGTLTVGGISGLGIASNVGIGLTQGGDPGTFSFTQPNAWIGGRFGPERAATTGNAFAVNGQIRLSSGTQTRGATFLADAPNGTVTNHTYFFANGAADRNAPTGTYSFYADSAAGAAYIGATTHSTGVGSGALQVAGGIYAGAASVFGGALTNRIDQNASTDVYVRNGTTGTAASSSFVAYDGTYLTQLGLINAGFTTSGPYVANSSHLSSNAPAGLRLISQAGEMRFYSSNTLALTLAASTQAAAFAGAVSIGTSASAVTGIRSATAACAFGTVAAGASTDVLVSITGVASSHSVIVNVTDASPPATPCIMSAIPVGAGVYVRVTNPTGSGIVIGTLNVRITAIGF